MVKKARFGEREERIAEVLRGYDTSRITIATFGSHSALDAVDGAKDEGFPTTVLCERGRERTYLRNDRIVDNPVVLDRFGQLLEKKMQRALTSSNSVFVPNRSFTTYIPVNRIISEFNVPVFGNVHMLGAEGRSEQNAILTDAGIAYPKRFTTWEGIDRLCMVKAKEPVKRIEREFFAVSSPEEFRREVGKRFGRVTDQILHHWLRSGEMWIEEFVIGAHFNFNYFYSPIKERREDRLEFLGIDRRIQTNIDGMRRLPPGTVTDIKPSYVEIGHESATIRESMLEKVYDIGERLVDASQRMYGRGIIGPFALQGAVTPDLEPVIFDFSPRLPGAPVLYNSPYSKYYFGFNVTSGRRVAMEVKAAVEQGRLAEVVS